MSLVHLHRHSEHSLLDGLGTATQYAERAVELGQGFLAQTDHGTLSGSLQHMQACREAHIVPILGVEAYYRDNRLDHSAENKEYFHMTLLAKGTRGWKSLMRITSEAFQSGFYYKPCVDRDLIEREAEDLVCLSGCLSGYLPRSIMRGNNLRSYMEFARKAFGDDFYIELMPHDIDELRQVNPELIRIANDLSTPVVATVDTHYPYREWASTQNISIMIARATSFKEQQAKRDAGEDVYEYDCDTLWLMDEYELASTFHQFHPDLPTSVVQNAIDMSETIAQKIASDPFVMPTTNKVPKVEGGTRDTLEDWAWQGMDRIGKQADQTYIDRLNAEMKVLENFGVIDYFVMVGDIVRWCKEQGIRAEARGSVGGSLLAYLLQITLIDPIAYGLLFERFLNPDRKGLPDIDIDFQHDRRDEVKGYVASKYGEDHVADVMADQTFKARSVLQSLGRVYDVDFPRMVALTKTIDEKYDGTLEALAEINDDVARFRDDFPEAWLHATRLLGQNKAHSRHAAALVVTDKPVSEYIPLERAKDGSVITAWNDNNEQLANIGIVKYDMLGVKGLTKTEGIFKETGEEPDDLPICADPYAVEPEVMEAFEKGLTLGVWQFESRGVTNVLRKTRPEHMFDLIAINALYRPGPIEQLDNFIALKRGEIDPSYWPGCEPFLEESYGLLIYQEQVMKIVRALGGFTAGEADDMRKAIGKYYRLPGDQAQQFMQTYYDKWAAGCQEQGLTQEEGDLIWSQILPFGNYAFNKSHAGIYARRAYVDMWNKVHHPLPFYAQLLSYPPSDAKKKAAQIKAAIREAMLFDVHILPPDVNSSDWGFTVSDDGIRFGLLSVKGVGDVAVQEILEKRADGPFHSLADFEERITKKRCNAGVRRALLQAGAFDSLGERTEFDDRARAELEREYLGIGLTGTGFSPELIDFVQRNIYTEAEFDDMTEQSGVTVGGEVDNYRMLRTKNNHPYSRGEIVFGTNHWSFVCWNPSAEIYHELLSSNKLLMISGQKDDRGQLIVGEVATAESVVEALEEVVAA